MIIYRREERIDYFDGAKRPAINDTEVLSRSQKRARMNVATPRWVGGALRVSGLILVGAPGNRGSERICNQLMRFS